MSTAIATTVGVVGTPLDRVDGRLKVTGAATYPIDMTVPGLAYTVLVPSTVTSGRIARRTGAVGEKLLGHRSGGHWLGAQRGSEDASHS